MFGLKKRMPWLKRNKKTGKNPLNQYNKRYTEPFGKADSSGKGNIIFSRDISMSMDWGKIHRNGHVVAVGGNGSDMENCFIGPNLMQANCSYIICDPEGGLFRQYAGFLEYKGYRLKSLNLIDPEKGNHYNPFSYIRSEKDVAAFTETVIVNTKKTEQGNLYEELRWDRAEAAILNALTAYLHGYAGPDRQNISCLVHLLESELDRYNSPGQPSFLEDLFGKVEQTEPESFAVKSYRLFQGSAGKCPEIYFERCLYRLRAFEDKTIAELTSTDDIGLDNIGDEKTALFIITPQNSEPSLLPALLLEQFIRTAFEYSETTARFSQLVADNEDNVLHTFRADDQEQAKTRRTEAERFLERAKKAHAVCRENSGTYSLVTEEGEIIASRGTKEEADRELSLIREGGHILPNSQQSMSGARLPVHVRIFLDVRKGSETGRIPSMDMWVATSRKYEISYSIMTDSVAQLKKIYKDDWPDITGNCDTVIYFGGDTDGDTIEWVSNRANAQTTQASETPPLAYQANIRFGKQKADPLLVKDLGSLPKDECIIIHKAMPAYKGPKYILANHPMWPLIEKTRK